MFVLKKLSHIFTWVNCSPTINKEKKGDYGCVAEAVIVTGVVDVGTNVIVATPATAVLVPNELKVTSPLNVLSLHVAVKVTVSPTTGVDVSGLSVKVN